MPLVTFLIRNYAFGTFLVVIVTLRRIIFRNFEPTPYKRAMGAGEEQENSYTEQNKRTVRSATEGKNVVRIHSLTMR